MKRARGFTFVIAACLLLGASASRGEGIWSVIIGASKAAPELVPETQAAPATRPDGDEFAAANGAATEPAATMAATKPAATTAPAVAEIKMPPGKPWAIRMPTKGVEISMWVPEGWEKRAPSDKSPPVIFKQGKDNDTHRATWYFVIVEIKRGKPENVMDLEITGRTTKTKDFRIREQKSIKRPDGSDAATMLFTYTDAKGMMVASRETYGWVDDDHLLITFEWAQVSAWRECHRDMEAMTAAVKFTTFAPEIAAFTNPPAATRPIRTGPDSADPILPMKR